MIYLNLMAPEKIKEIRRRLTAAAFAQALLILAVALFINAAALFAGRTIIKNTEGRLETERQKLENQYRDLNAAADAANRELGGLKNVSARFRPISGLYRDLVAGVPAGISVSALSVDYLNDKVRLAGRADTREHLLAYHAALEADARFSDVKLPLSNIALRADIPFEFSLTLKK